MNLEPMLNAPLMVQIHVAAVLPAFVIGTWQIFVSTKGARPHRILGAAYLVLMTIAALTAFGMRAHVGPTFLGFGLLHLLAVLTLWGVFNAIAGLRTGDIARHRRGVIGTYVGGLVIAGALSFIPGRIMNAVLFG